MGEKISNLEVPKKSVTFKSELLTVVLLTVVAALSAFNLKSFISAGHLVPGGFSGLAVLVQRVGSKFLNIEIPYSFIYIPLNVVPAYICFKTVGKRFTFLSLYYIIVSALLTDMIPSVPITDDRLLICVFGGIIGGFTGGMVIIRGACTGGTDFLAIWAAEKRGVNMWYYSFAFTVVIIILAGLIDGSDAALYSIIYQFVGTQVLQTMDKRFNKETMLIVTQKPNEVTTVINNKTGHSSTMIDGVGSYTEKPNTIIYSVVDHSQIMMITKLIHEVDPNAFINVFKTEQVKGKYFRVPR